ncbi:MAG: histidine kinase [Clostridiaceae bacterium]|nr:histidine kinase [Clostridiaceae bacterium]
MKQGNFSQFIQDVILNASQMAYLEDAQKTHTMLLSFTELYRYLIKPGVTATLAEEMNGLKNYIDIQIMRYGDRLNVEFPEENYDNLSVKHIEIIGYFDNLLNNALAQYENRINIVFKIINQSNAYLKILLNSDNSFEDFSIVLMEEGRSVV